MTRRVFEKLCTKKFALIFWPLSKIGNKVRYKRVVSRQGDKEEIVGWFTSVVQEGEGTTEVGTARKRHVRTKSGSEPLKIRQNPAKSVKIRQNPAKSGKKIRQNPSKSGCTHLGCTLPRPTDSVVQEGRRSFMSTWGMKGHPGLCDSQTFCMDPFVGCTQRRSCSAKGRCFCLLSTFHFCNPPPPPLLRTPLRSTSFKATSKNPSKSRMLLHDPLGVRPILCGFARLLCLRSDVHGLSEGHQKPALTCH